MTMTGRIVTRKLTFFANSLYGDLSSFGKNAHQSPRILVIDLMKERKDNYKSYKLEKIQLILPVLKIRILFADESAMALAKY